MIDYDLIDDIDGITKAQNAKFFTTDLVPIHTGIFTIQLSLSASVIIEVTFDSGSNWTALNSNVALGIDQLFIFDVGVKTGDAFNMRIPTAGGAVVDIGRVYQVN